MKGFDKTVAIINEIVEDAKDKGIIQLSTDNSKIEDSMIQIGGKSVVNFGSCSYLSLEFEEKLKMGVRKALANYGTQYSSSRAYVSLGLYNELEELLGQLFGGHCIVTPSTTMGHLAAIPVLVSDNDAVILDHQVHSSVQTATTLLKPRGVNVELVRHNNMEALEQSIIRLQETHDKVWYMADGIYSMYGDQCPVHDLEELLKKYPKFHVYLDDAHGFSWYGKHGRGYVLEHMELQDRMIVAASLSKSFGAGGGVLVFPNKALKTKVRNCGGTLIFSGPLQPPILGAAIESAKLHLSDEFLAIQQKLISNIDYTRKVIKELDLPLISHSTSPVFFIGVSLKDLGVAVVQKLLERGHYTNLGAFPAVSLKNTGIRFTITRSHTKEQIDQFLHDLKEILNEEMVKFDFRSDMIYTAFRKQLMIQNKTVLTAA